MLLHPEEYRARILAAQGLTAPGHFSEIAGNLCGIQAQYQGHAQRALSLRSCDLTPEDANQTLVKSWTLRGTLHAFPKKDLPLFLHAGRRPFLRPVDTLETDPHATAARKAYFSQLILEALREGPRDREGLKSLCREKGMTETEQESLFNPWGGLLRALCEAGRICHAFTQEKIFLSCPDFTSLEEEAARHTLLARYLAAYGPATISDAAYFFGTTQRAIRERFKTLSLAEYQVEDRVCFGFPLPEASPPPIPFALFLGGFDPLLLGYDPRNSPFLPPEHRQKIFTAGGQVQPALLINGTVAGRWKQQGTKLTVTPFLRLSKTEGSLLEAAAFAAFPQIRQVLLLP